MDNLVSFLTKQNNAIKNIQQSLKNINKEEPDTIKRISLLNTEIKNINKNLDKVYLEPSIKEEIESNIRNAKSEISKLEQNAKNEFGKNLDKTLKDNGFVLEGNYPKLRTSIYTLIVDILGNKVDLYYGPEIEKIDTCKPTVNDVATKLLNHYKDLSLKEFSDDVFLKNLYDAYNICLLQHNKNMGEEIPISDILFSYAFIVQDKKFKKNPLKKYYKEYNRIDFSYDLHRLKVRKINNFELKLVTARRGETNKKLDFLWIPSSNKKGIGESISRIKFSKVE